MSPALEQAAAWGLASAALAFALLLGWRTARRARRRLRDRARVEGERQPEHRARLAARLGCAVEDLPELGGWKITPDFACVLIDLVDETQPRRVLELGSGSSTVVLAMLLAPSSATLASLEQDAAHVERTRAMLKERGLLSSRTRVEHAPLSAEAGAHEGDPPWYSAEAVARLDGKTGPPWDLVIVDGPSTTGRADSRLPALPRLHSMLSARAVVVLDDAIRPGERAIVAAWRGMGLLQDFDVTDVPVSRGAVVMRRRG